MILQGKQLNVIVPILGVFISAAFRMLPSLNRIMSSTQNIKYTQPVINLIYDELENLNNFTKITNNNILPFNNEIILSNIKFYYNNNKKTILDNISFNIKKGQSIGIIGQSGAGKSTIVDIILGLLNITKGSVLVDGIDISTSITSWQNNIGYVPQNIYLIDDSIIKNIAFGIEDEDINIERVNHTIELAQLSEFIDSLELGINSIVGDRGSKLSGGQKQRIGIARALYRNPQILILDEATSALDNETEHDFMKAINNLKGSITTIIIAHRLSTVANSDYIYVLENGRLINSGTPAQIL
jgi:ABC-type multidrug transport system fused ATPase/permease subunit